MVSEDKRSMVVFDQTIGRFASIKRQNKPIERRILQQAITFNTREIRILKTCEVENWQAAEMIGEIDVFMGGGVGQINLNLS